MSHIERELVKQVDDAIINASPEFLKLIRDMVVAPFFLVIAFTLYRLPSCILNVILSPC